jgi:hypothetical protein
MLPVSSMLCICLINQCDHTVTEQSRVHQQYRFLRKPETVCVYASVCRGLPRAWTL